MSAGLGALNPIEQVEVMGRIPEPTRAGCEMVPDVIGNQSLAAFVSRKRKTTCSTLTFADAPVSASATAKPTNRASSRPIASIVRPRAYPVWGRRVVPLT